MAHSAPVLEKAIESIELLASVPAGLPIAEIAARMNRSMSDVFRIIGKVSLALGWSPVS